MPLTLERIATKPRLLVEPHAKICIASHAPELSSDRIAVPSPPLSKLVHRAIASLQQPDVPQLARAQILANVFGILRRHAIPLAEPKRELLLQYLLYSLHDRSFEQIDVAKKCELLKPLVDEAIKRNRAFSDERNDYVLEHLFSALQGAAPDSRAHMLNSMVLANKQGILRIPGDRRPQLAACLLTALRSPHRSSVQSMNFLTALMPMIGERAFPLIGSDLTCLIHTAFKMLDDPNISINRRAGLCAHLGMSAQNKSICLTRGQALQLCGRAFRFIRNPAAGAIEKSIMLSTLSMAALGKQMRFTPSLLQRTAAYGLRVAEDPALPAARSCTLSARLLALTRFFPGHIDLQTRHAVIEAACDKLESEKFTREQKLIVAAHLVEPLQMPVNEVALKVRLRFPNPAIALLWDVQTFTRDQLMVARKLAGGASNGMFPLTTVQSRAFSAICARARTQPAA